MYMWISGIYVCVDLIGIYMCAGFFTAATTRQAKAAKQSKTAETCLGEKGCQRVQTGEGKGTRREYMRDCTVV